MSNLISDRVAYFLREYPPFSYLEEDELDEVAQKITVKHFDAEETLFEEGETDNDFCYVLRQGNIKLLKGGEDGRYLVDQCEPGDVFGVRSILTGNPYSMTASCAEESLVYAMPKSQFKRLINRHRQFSLFFASGYAAGQVIVREDRENGTALSQNNIHDNPLNYTREVVQCKSDVSVQEAARLMQDANVGSIIITNDQKHPLGIVTDTDFRNKVLADGRPLSVPISEIMSSPVKSVSPSITLTEVMMEMIRSGVHHLVLTKNGETDSPVCGIVSDHDVVISQQNHPAALIKAIKYSNDPGEWARIRDQTEVLLENYLNQGISIPLVASLITKVNDTIITKALDFALNGILEAREIEFCWLNLGSEGREEQLLRTDQDNAILFRDTEDNDRTQSILLKVAAAVNEILEKCGFEKCPADIMARNPTYCQPLSAWKDYFTKWIESPDPKAVMNATIFFDFRHGYGSEALVNDLEDHLVTAVGKHEIFINFLAQNALQNPPPLSFFKNFLVERSGEHKDEFDVKKRAMMPLSDAARLLTLHHKVTGVQNTVKRFEKLMELEPSNAALFESAAESYEIFMKHRAINGLKDGDSGRFIDLQKVSKLEKQMLKNAFVSIKEVQDLVKVRFQLSYFSS